MRKNESWFGKQLEFYQDHALRSLLPFWRKAADTQYGGVFTCYTNRGDRRISTDKFTWSQGRFLWLWSRIAAMCRAGSFPDEADGYILQAEKTYTFLRDCAFLPDGSCSFLLTREGRHKEAFPGQGYDVSFYADCFVILGFSEFARLTGELEALERAVALYGHVRDRLRRNAVRSEPYPVPEGYEAHAFSMIMLNVSQELADTLERFGDDRAGEVRAAAVSCMERIMFRFCDERSIVSEMLVVSDQGRPDSVLARHVNPGHSIESMWFVLTEAVKQKREEIIRRAADVTEQTFRLGWDEEEGGLLRYTDRDGGPPSGEITGDRFERLILDTWDMKLWWPHSETLYTTILCYGLTGETRFLDMYRKTFEYTFRIFPNPDPRIGEWIQIRDRKGSPVEAVVALPVKDPYHILRNVLLLIEWFAERGFDST